MEQQMYCTHCNQKIRKMNPLRVCNKKVQMLEMLAKANDWVYVQAGHGAMVNGQMTRAPYRAQSLCSVLVWFGLAEHSPERRSGIYRITDDGFKFLQGKHLVPKTIWSLEGRIVDRDTTMVAISSVRNVVLDKDYWDNYHQLQVYPHGIHSRV